jgi:hypothetical protein
MSRSNDARRRNPLLSVDDHCALQVDDDEFSSTVLCAMLQRFEATPTCATDGESALNRWDEQQDDQRLDVVRLPGPPLPRPCFSLG